MKNLPSKCGCGQHFDTTHAMNCKKGGYDHTSQFSTRLFHATLLNKVCSEVMIEPKLRSNDEARADVKGRGFWRSGQAAYFDVMITNPNSSSQVDRIYANHENEKKRMYNQRILDNEHGSFTPLVYSLWNGSRVLPISPTISRQNCSENRPKV